MTTSFPFWICAKVKPILVELASTNSKNGSRKLGYAKMGAEIKARLSLSKPRRKLKSKQKERSSMSKHSKGW